MKKILFLLLAVTLFCCCSSDDGEQIIMRTEYYYKGEWKHRADKTLYWSNGGFYKVKLVGSSGEEIGDPYTDIVLSGDILQLQSDPGTKYKKIK